MVQVLTAARPGVSHEHISFSNTQEFILVAKEARSKVLGPSPSRFSFPSLNVFVYRYILVDVGLGALQRCGWLPGPSGIQAQGGELQGGKP